MPLFISFSSKGVMLAEVSFSLFAPSVEHSCPLSLSSEPSRLKDTLVRHWLVLGHWLWDCWDTLVSTQRHCCLGHWLVLRHSCLDSKNCLGHWLVLAQRCRWCPSFRPEVTAHSSPVTHQLNTSLNTFNT